MILNSGNQTQFKMHVQKTVVIYILFQKLNLISLIQEILIILLAKFSKNWKPMKKFEKENVFLKINMSWDFTYTFSF